MQKLKKATEEREEKEDESDKEEQDSKEESDDDDEEVEVEGIRCHLFVTNWYMHDSCVYTNGKILHGALDLFKVVPSFFTPARRKKMLGHALEPILSKLGDDDSVIPPLFKPCMDGFAQNPTTDRIAALLPMRERDMTYFSDDSDWNNHAVSNIVRILIFC